LQCALGVVLLIPGVARAQPPLPLRDAPPMQTGTAVIREGESRN